MTTAVAADPSEKNASADSGAILLPDLKIGNMASVANIVRKSGGRARIVTDPSDLRGASKIILAGVGSFDAAMRTAIDEGWTGALNEFAQEEGNQVLGICLGMQLMCNSSEEGKLPGLGWIDATVRRFRLPPGSGLKSPHMGWNTLKVIRENPFIPVEGEQRFYFVHSYFVQCSDPADIVATANHGEDFTAAIAHRNVFGVQFHPEKSHRFGMELIRKFVEL
jgi:glutamine amidotransferase